MLLVAILSLSAASRVAVSIHGLSVSPAGFVAVLLSRSPDRALPVRITGPPVDRDKVQSPEALTLLQLWQGIDMAGPLLPPELLSTLAGVEGAKLLQVRVRAQGDSSSRAACELLVAAGGRELECEASAYEGIGLCLRYGAQIVAEAAALEEGGIDYVDLETYYPVCFTRDDADAQRRRIDEDMRVALAATPLLQPPPPPRNANAPPVETLLRALQIARERRDDAAVAKIEQKLREEYGEEYGKKTPPPADAAAAGEAMEQLMRDMRRFEADEGGAD